VSSPAYFLCVSPDHLCASLHSTGFEDAGSAAVRLGAQEDVRSLLARAGVVHGLNQETIARAEDCVYRALPLTEPLDLARGTPPTAGRKGLLSVHVPTPLRFVETSAEGQTRQVEILLAPLVRVGETIAQTSPPTLAESGRNVFGQETSCPLPTEQTAQPGDNVVLDPETGRLTAAVVGYPSFSVSRRGATEHLALGVDRLIRVSPDRMQAVLHLKPAPSGHDLPSQNSILHMLDDEGIVFGRLPHAVQKALELCVAEQRPQNAIIALGALPVKGKDAWLRFAMEIGPLPGKLMGNGEIDFRERNMFVGVNKDQLIAVKIAPSPGTPGCDIFGEPIAPLPGADIEVRAMDEAILDEATGQIRALRSGVLSMVSENSVKVCSRHVVDNHVDYLTGNIISRDGVDVRGSIKAKFKVNALGDVLVAGDVEKGQLRSDGNVVIKGGVIGRIAAVQARGDVDVAFVVQGRVLSGKTLVLRQHASHCHLHSSGILLCQPSSRIIASHLVASGSIIAGSVGSDMAPPSLLAAAVEPEQLQRYFELQRILADQSEAIEALRRRLGHSGHAEDNEELEELIAEYESNSKQLTRLNLIVAKDRQSAHQALAHAMQCSIVVRGKIFAGTELRIGNSAMTLTASLTDVSFRLRDHVAAGANKRDIIIAPNK
jgi:uncharacterized protein (DUF342 family)